MSDLNEKISESLRELYESKEFLQEKLILKFSEKLYEVLQKKGLNHQDFAKKLNVSKAYISKIMNGKPNLTLKSIADIAFVLNLWPEIQLSDRDSFYSRKEVRVFPESDFEKPCPISNTGEPHASNFALAA